VGVVESCFADLAVAGGDAPALLLAVLRSPLFPAQCALRALSDESSEYIPGDVPALRSIPAGAALQAVVTLHSKIPLLYGSGAFPTGPGDIVFALSVLEGFALYNAAPFFLPGELALAAAESVPPERSLVDALRLPFSSVWVVFGHDLELPEHFSWPDEMDSFTPISDPGHALHFLNDGSWSKDISNALRHRGGAITGVVLFAGPDGVGLADEIIWTVSANPDPDAREILRNDHQRGFITGFRSDSLLAPVIDNLAAVVAGAQWRETPKGAPTIGAHGSDRWFRSLGRPRARKLLDAGAFTGVRVIDLAATRRASGTGPDAESLRARPHEHPRRGHTRGVRVATRDTHGQIVGSVHGERGKDWHYSIRWVPPTLVNPGVGAVQAVSVWRLPDLSSEPATS
jgi:hypothetical protein